MTRRVAVAALAASYPVLVLVGVAMGSEGLRLAGLAALLLAVALPGLLAGRWLAWCGAAVCAAALIAAARSDKVMIPLLLTPIVIPGVVAWTFGRTLVRGRIPLIEQFMRLLYGAGETIEPERLAYARSVTIGWTFALAGLAVANAALGALTAPGGFLEMLGMQSPLQVSNNAWALFTNVIGYVAVGAFFLAEYAYRRYRFPNQPYRNFVDFVIRTVAAARRPPERATAAVAREGSTPEGESRR